MTHRDLSRNQIETINAVYSSVPETVDSLPYTTSFEKIFEASPRFCPGLSKNALHKLLNDLRKAGLLVRKGR